MTSYASAAPNDEITVLGTRLSVEAAQSPELIDKEQIEASSASTLAELLRQLPGITSIDPGGAGGITEVYLRGADPNFTTVFVDGVQVNNPTDPRGGAFDFTTLMPDEVQQIELVRGPFSALYGSGALAGAIDLITRPAGTPEQTGVARLSAGSDGYWHTGVGLQGEFEAIDAGVSANHVDFGEPTESSQRTVSSVGGFLNAELSPTLQAELTLRAMSTDRAAYPVASGGPRLATAEILEVADSEEVILGGTLKWQFKRHQETVRLTYMNSEANSTTAAIPDGVFSGTPQSTSGLDFRRLQAMLHSRVLLTDSIEFGSGLEFQHEQGSTQGDLDFGFFQVPTDFRKNRNTLAPFAEGRARLSPSVTAYAGLRYDDYSDGDSTLSPRLGAEYRHQRSGVKLNISWGEARKKPSFYALGDPLVGNPLLEPEDSSGYEVGLEWPLLENGVTVSVSVFDYAYDNLIDFDFATFSLVNRSSVEIDGGEVRVDSARDKRWSWSVFASTQRNRVNGNRNSLLHRPEFSAGAIANWQPNDSWQLMIAANHDGTRRSSSIPGGETTLDSYTRVNLAATRSISKNVDVVLSLDNILDEDYEVVTGFNSAGRQIRASARFAL